MTEQYKIVGLYYTHPKTTWDAKGEVVFRREGISVMVGTVCDFGGLPRKVESITFDDDTNSFRVVFAKGGLKTIPMNPDTEVLYELAK